MAEKHRSRRVQRLLNCGAALFFLLLAALCLGAWRLGLFRSMDALQTFVREQGAWAPLAFLLLQVAQILMAFIPGGLLLCGGVILFGPWLGLFYNFLGTCLGSCLNFWLARRWGQPLVRHLMPEATRQKYFRWLEDRRFDRLFAWAILLPFFPDDALCLLAGLSPMPLRRFLAILLLKLPAIAAYSVIWLATGHFF